MSWTSPIGDHRGSFLGPWPRFSAAQGIQKAAGALDAAAPGPLCLRREAAATLGYPQIPASGLLSGDSSGLGPCPGIAGAVEGRKSKDINPSRNVASCVRKSRIRAVARASRNRRKKPWRRQLLFQIDLWGRPRWTRQNTGAPARSRTWNLLIRSQMLYPIELRVRSRSCPTIRGAHGPRKSHLPLALVRGAFHFLDPLAGRLSGNNLGRRSLRQRVSKPSRASSLVGA